MNIYEKLQVMRCELQAMALKKSGKNKFAGYDYFELHDIIPAINELMKAHKVTSTVQYDKEMAKLTLVNSEDPIETLIFTSPMSEATLKGCHAVQNLGASITYLRRYLWINALEIVESDALDSSKPLDSASIKKKEESLKSAPKVALTVKQALLKKEGEVFNVIVKLRNTKERITKNKKDVTDYYGSDSDSDTKIIICKFGKTHEGLKENDIVIFKDVKVSTYKGDLTYLAHDIEKIGK